MTPKPCPIHRPGLQGNGDVCLSCEIAEQLAVKCEIDKVQRVKDSLHAQGFEMTFGHAVLIFKKRKGQTSQPSEAKP